MFIEYRPTVYIAKQSETRATRNNLHFSCYCYKKICFHTGYAAIENSWRTIDERESDIATTSVFDCQFSPVGRLMANKNSVFYYFWSTFVDNIDVFDCRLSGVNSLYVS